MDSLNKEKSYRTVRISFFALMYIGSLFAVVFSLNSSFAIAYAPDPQYIADSIRQGFEYFKWFYTPIFEVIIGDYASNEFFFAKILLLFLVFLVIRGVLYKVKIFGDNKAANLVVALVVSILSIRYISDNEIIRGILLPYSTLFIAITTIIPFVVVFYALHAAKFGSGARKLAWAFYLAVLGILWANRASEFSAVANEIYVAIFILAILAILFDKNIRAYFAMAEIKKARRNVDNSRLVDLFDRYQKAKKQAHTSWGKAEIDSINKELKEMGKSFD